MNPAKAIAVLALYGLLKLAQGMAYFIAGWCIYLVLLSPVLLLLILR